MARSFHLKDATNLQGRPPLHCTTIPVILTAVLLLLSKYLMSENMYHLDKTIILSNFYHINISRIPLLRNLISDRNMVSLLLCQISMWRILFAITNMSHEVDNLSTIVYAGLGVALLLIVALSTATIFLFWKVHKLSKSSSSNGNKAEEESKDLGLQLVNQRFHIPKPKVKGNNDSPSKFGDENKLSGMRFRHDDDERRSNNISLQGSAFKNQFSGHNNLDAISDSNFSFTRPNQDDFSNNRSQEERRPNMGIQGNSRQNDYDHTPDHFSFTSQTGPQNELRNKRDQEERRATGLNLHRGSFRNPLSAQNNFDSFDDNRGPFPLQRNMQRNIHY
ncbi:hypothetical protein CBL_12266 [Carabus blaptoides fortunei]